MKEKLLKHKKLWIVLVILLIVAIIAAIFMSRMKAERQMMMEAMNQQETALVEKRTLVSSISATGTVTSVGSKEVSVPLSSVEVKSVSVKVGDSVKEGDVLCEFDSEDIEQNLADAKASLAVTSGKTSIEVSASERSLLEAETTRDIEAERASQDVADAWNDYLKALTDLEEAESEWNEAKETTAEKNGEYEYRQELLEEAEKKMNAAASGSGQSGSYEEQFLTTKAAMNDYIITNGKVSANNGIMDKIYITSSDLSSISADSDFAYSGSNDENAECKSSIAGYLGTLQGLQQKYQECAQIDAGYQQAQTEYNAMQQEVSTWQTKYNTAKQSESSLENAYEQAVSAAESKLDAYNQKVRSQQDTQRSNNSNVANKTDNVTTSQLSATTSGQSDKQKVKQYEEQLEDCTVMAPMSGVITEVNIEEGDTYNGTAIVTIEDTSAYEVSAEIDEYDIGKVEIGQQVVIKTNGTGDEELNGTVQEIAPRATTGSSEVTYTVTISIDTPNDLLRMDMTAKLSIIQESKENVLTVPYEAVMEDENGEYYIEVLKESGENTQNSPKSEELKSEEPKSEEPVAGDKPQMGEMPENASNKVQGASSAVQTERIKVTKGIESDYYIEVISESLKEGMEVVVPRTEEKNADIQGMMMRQGPMGGF